MILLLLACSSPKPDGGTPDSGHPDSGHPDAGPIYTGPAQVQLRGNGTPLGLGNTPAAYASTDFGRVQAGAVAVVRRFVVRNVGGEDLTLGSNALSLSANTAFALVDSLPAKLGPGEHANFGVSFTSPGPGVSTATVTLTSNDSTHPTLSFDVHGEEVSGTPHDYAFVEDHQPLFGPFTAMLDLNGDGVVDMVTLDWDYPSGITTPRAWMNDGAGNFTEATTAVFGATLPATNGPHRWVVGDFDGDGRDDLFIAENGSDVSPWEGSQNTLLLQKTGGVLTDVTSTLPALKALNYSVADGDLDGDGSLDLWIGDVHSQVSVFPFWMRNDGHAQFSDVKTGLPVILQYDVNQQGQQFYSSAILDADLDGSADVFLGGVKDTHHDVLLHNDGAQTFTVLDGAVPERLRATQSTTETLVVTDLDNDGWPDVVANTHVDYSNPGIQILINNHDGTFRDETSARIASNDWTSWYYQAGTDHAFINIFALDVDGDGRQDLFLEGNSMSSLLLHQEADGTFVLSRHWTDPQGPYVIGVTPADLDGDGVVDFLSITGTH